MPRKPLDADDPRRWLVFAQSDLRLARKGHIPGVRLEGLCYLSQQAAEKAVKAVLMHHKIHFPKTHQIQTLLEFLPLDLTLPAFIRNAADLSDYAVEGRYPQNFEDITRAEYISALKKAEAVVTWASKMIRALDESEGHPTSLENPADYRTGKTKKKQITKRKKK